MLEYGTPNNLVRLANNCFAENSSDFGGGIFVQGYELDVKNNTIVYNTASLAGHEMYLAGSTCTLLNSIMHTSHSVSMHHVHLYNSSLSVDYCYMQDSEEGVDIDDEGNNCHVDWGDHNIYDPGYGGPKLVRAITPDTMGFLYALVNGSPCIEAGDNDCLIDPNT